VDEVRFAQAEKAYAAGDWRTAAREYLAAVHGAPAEASGRSYHMAGNSLMKLRRYSDAATVYGHAVKDPYYDKRGPVLANLGAALAADGRYGDSVAAYDAALEEPSFDTPWKALQGKGGALYDMGRYEEACQAYREASWVEGNPDPGKALNNLGLCFMALGRPEDAIEAYKGAVGLDGGSARGRASANLGLAYAAMGFHDEAVRAFEAACDRYGHELSGASLTAYEESKKAAGRGETVEGWSTGEMAPAIEGSVGSTGPVAGGPGATAAEDEKDDRFFTRTEDDMKEEGRAALRDERKLRRGGKGAAVRIAAIVAVVIALLVGIALGWSLGYGYPMHTTTVGEMLDAYRDGKDASAFWVAVPPADVKQEMRRLPARMVSYTIDGATAGPSQSTVYVTVRLEDQATMRYQVWLVREGVGWRVNGIQNDFGSTPSGS
jgi:tetratricopeptide (TPR) repeat protein